MAESSGNRLTIVYEGALAAQGEMYFYEYSRAAYGASRLINTIEHFRRTGRVAQRISARNYVPLVIKAPVRGSFPIDILIPFIAQSAQIIKEYDIPVGEFIKYIIHLMKRTLPKDESTIVELAKLDLKKEEQRTAQSEQETNRIVEIRKIVESGNANTGAAISVLETALQSSDKRISEIGTTQKDISRILQSLREQDRRQRDLEPFAEKLSAIGEDKLLRLASKVRPQLADVGLPLKHSRSADNMSLKLNGQEIANFDEDAIRDINSRALDPTDTISNVRIFAFDKDSGHGKCDLLDLDVLRISFSVPVYIRTRLKPYIIDAMNEESVRATMRFFRNKNRLITSVLISQIEHNPHF